MHMICITPCIESLEHVSYSSNIHIQHFSRDHFVDQSMRDVYLLPQNMSNIRLVWWYNLFFLVSPIIQEFNSHRLGVLVGLYNLCTIEKDSLPLESGKTMRPPLLAR